MEDLHLHLYHLILPSLEKRQALIDHLRRQNIVSVFHYTPLHLSRMGRRYGGQPGDCPVTERVSERLLRLPFYNSLSENDLARIRRLLQIPFDATIRRVKPTQLVAVGDHMPEGADYRS